MQDNKIFNELFVLELANNHWGNIQRGLKIVQDYASNNSIEMIIKKDNILIGKNDLDATKEVLDLFNESVESIEVN